MKTSGGQSFRLLVSVVLIMIIVTIAIFVLPRIVSCLLPFLLAWIVSLVIKPLVNGFEKIHLNRRISVIISMLLVICAICGVLYALSGVVIREVKDAVELFSHTKDGIPLFVWDVLDVLPGALRNSVVNMLQSMDTDYSSLFTSALQSFLPRLGGFAGRLPGAFVFTVVFILAVYFMSYEPKGLKAEIKKILPEDKYRFLFTLKQSFLKACGGYIRAQLIIMSIVFCILLIGFVVLDVRFAVLLAFVISMIDAIPVLGTGMILNPWAVVCLLQGDFVTAAGLAGLYVIILVMRQLVEPRILSGQLGIHPIITLVAMYTGLKVIGIFGMILGPLTALIIINFIKVNRNQTEDKEVTTDVCE